MAAAAAVRAAPREARSVRHIRTGARGRGAGAGGLSGPPGDR
jgi:hypothetical protein